MKNIDIVKIKTVAKMGCAENNCIRDAMELAVKEWNNVEMKHNGRIFNISVNDMFASVKKEGQ